MTGELIPTGATFGAGRRSINDQFSGTAEFNNIKLQPGAHFSGGTGGGKLLSGGTDLYSIFTAGTSGDLWSASTAVGSIIQNNSLGNSCSSQYGVAIGSGCTVYGGTGGARLTTNSFCNIFGGINNKIGYGVDSGFMLEVCSTIVGGKNNTITSMYGVVRNSAIISGLDNNISSNNSAIIGGSGNTIGASQNSVVLGGQSLSVPKSNTAIMQRAHVDEYLDLEPRTVMPDALIGRIFFSGGSLNKLMYCQSESPEVWVAL